MFRPFCSSLCRLLSIIVFSVALQTWIPSPVSQAQTPGLDICIDDFEDRNQNGQRDEGEPPFVGVEVYLKRENSTDIIGSLVTGTDEDCFRSLSAGTYVVEFGGNRALQTTTASPVVLTLSTEPVTLPLGISTCRPDTDAPANQICVLVYHDVNRNGQRDGGEAILPNINVNLTEADVITRTIVTSTDFVCFTALPPGDYRVVIPAANNHTMTTLKDAGFRFQAQNRSQCVEFGAEPVDPLTLDAELPNSDKDDEFTIDQETRLLFGVLGAMVVILFMTGLGVMLFAIIRR